MNRSAMMMTRQPVTIEPDIAAVAALLGEPSRAAICQALLDGSARPAGELARLVRVSPQTASAHLDKLLQGQILAVERQGRWRYYRLNGHAVAAAVEALAVIAPRAEPPARPTARKDDSLRQARTCYTHFAGKLGVGLAVALVKRQWIEPTGQRYVVTPHGAERFAELGIDLCRLRGGPRGLAYPCLDWSERQHHLAGPLATAILERIFTLDWVRRLPRTRAVLVTPLGRSELRRLLDFRLQ